MAKDKPLEITQVTYSLLKNLGNYENERIELTAKCHHTSDAEKIALDLKDRAIDILEVTSRLRKRKN